MRKGADIMASMTTANLDLLIQRTVALTAILVASGRTARRNAHEK
jgi:hypothetical protein